MELMLKTKKELILNYVILIFYLTQIIKTRPQLELKIQKKHNLRKSRLG
jgi:hypothetical protein